VTAARDGDRFAPAPSPPPLPRSWLRRCRSNGVWFTRRDVPPGRFRRVIDFIEVAGPAAGSDAAA
jgi:hypothetical protein